MGGSCSVCVPLYITKRWRGKIQRVILRKPYCEIDTENVATLQFLDLIKEVVDISEVDGEELTNRLI